MSPIDIISLTPEGQQLAQRLLRIDTHEHHEVAHLHRPKPFKEIIQQRFKDKHCFIFICATGIVIRTISSVLDSKQEDPPVLVIDEKGQYVIPLLSGHEGGANRWAVDVAKDIGAQVVITSSQKYVRAQKYMDPILVVGMGCEKNCSLQKLQALFNATLQANNIYRKDIVALSSIDVKQHEPALVDLAKELDIPYVCYSAEALRTMESRLSERSEVVFNAVGCYGVAEAAALLHAQLLTQGQSELIVSKHKNVHATIAIARSI